jgi:predicted component of type VI protein secretion system
MPFQVSPLPYAPFASLFALPAAALTARRARLVIAEAGSPCRVSLVDAQPGERLLLTNYVHQPAATPFRASHAIFVREGAVAATPACGAVPPALATRLLSLRAFDAAGTIVAAEIVAGAVAAPAIAALLAAPGAVYLHAHFARYGCYAARIDRV